MPRSRTDNNIILADLGRQWFLSNRGRGDVRGTPRKHAFCIHAIISKDDILIIRDAKEDPRFANNPLVTGPPCIRFYASAPLQAGGYKLGTFRPRNSEDRGIQGLDQRGVEGTGSVFGFVSPAPNCRQQVPTITTIRRKPLPQFGLVSLRTFMKLCLECRVWVLELRLEKR